MNRGAWLLGAGAALVFVTALWLVFATRAALEVKDEPAPARREAVAPPPVLEPPPAPRPMAPPPRPRPVVQAPPPQPVAPPPPAIATGPLDVRFDEARLRRMPHPMSEPALTKIRASFDQAQLEAQKRLATGATAEEVLAPVRGAKRFLTDEMAKEPEPADTVQTALGFFDELEQQATARVRR